MTQRAPIHDRHVALLLLLGVALVYVALTRGVFLFGDDVLMFQVTESLVERRSVAVTSPTAEQAAGSFPDAAHAFSAAAIPGTDGRGYAKYGIGLSLVSIPAYATGVVLDPVLSVRVAQDPFGNEFMGPRILVTSFTSAVIGGATVALVFLLAVALDFRRITALILALITAFATPFTHYSTAFLSETLAALCLAAIVYGLLRASRINDLSSQEARRWLILSGFATGLGIATRSALAMSLVAPGLWMLWLAWRSGRASLRSGLLACTVWALPIVAWLGLVGLYNWSRFGSALESGYGAEARAYDTPILTGMYGLLASPGRGLFWYAPPVLLAVAGAFWFRRRDQPLALVILGSLLATLLLYSRYYAWHGGGVWGPRFLIPLLPLLILPAGEIIERAWANRLAAIAAVAASTLGLLVTALAVLVPFDRYVSEYTANAALHERAMWHLRDSPIAVHAVDLMRLDVTLDIAGARYASPNLAAFALATIIAGAALITVTTIRIGRSDLGSPGSESRQV